MPELPEVETIVRQLDREITGIKLGRVAVSRRDIVHGDPRPLPRLLAGRRVVRVRRRAKRIVLELKPAAELIFHLGMSGRLTLSPSGEPVEKHTHLRIALDRGKRELRFCDPRRFGGVWCFAGGDEHVGRRLGPVGPEPLLLKPSEFLRLLRRSRQIKSLLLDQRMIAGLGNIYCDESLHAAGICPTTEANDLDEQTARRLLRAIKATLRKAIRYKGTTFMRYQSADGKPGSFQRHCRVYGRVGQPCRTCGTTIERLQVAGRSTFFCPVCQG